jgi:hypothetical protein
MMSIHNDDAASLPDTNDGDLSVTGDGSVVSSSDAYLQFLQFTMFQNMMGGSTSSIRPGGADSSSSTAASMALMLKSVQSQQQEIASHVDVLKSEIKAMFVGLESKLIETNTELCSLKGTERDNMATMKKQIETASTETMTKFSSIDSQLRSTANNVNACNKRLEFFESDVKNQLASLKCSVQAASPASDFFSKFDNFVSKIDCRVDGLEEQMAESRRTSKCTSLGTVYGYCDQGADPSNEGVDRWQLHANSNGNYINLRGPSSRDRHLHVICYTIVRLEGQTHPFDYAGCRNVPDPITGAPPSQYWVVETRLGTFPKRYYPYYHGQMHPFDNLEGVLVPKLEIDSGFLHTL